MSEPPENTRDQSPDDARHLTLPPPVFTAGDAVPGLSSWLLVRKLGGGGFGEVWLAKHAWDSDQKPRAVKFCTDPMARHRLVTHEKNVVVRVMKFAPKHPNVVALLECNLDGSVPWLMFEFVEGGTLTRAIEQWRDLSPPVRLGRAVQTLHAIAAALARFHQLDPPIVHRDIKPHNVLMAGDVPRITDFGIGSVVMPPKDDPATGSLSAHAARLPSALRAAGTINYAPAEQRLGSLPDPRDDVYALGVIAYQMVTGDPKTVPGPDTQDVLTEQQVPAEFIAITLKSLAMDPAKRPKDATAWETTLAAILQKLQKQPDDWGTSAIRSPTGLPVPEPKSPTDLTPTELPQAGSTGGKTGTTGAWGAGKSVPPSPPPARLGRFEIRDLLGEGAFGRVYLAFDPQLERQVAIKVPKPEGLTPDLRDRFLREARATAKIHHPNVCPIHEVGTEGDLPYIVMHFVVGTTLASLLARLHAPMPPRNAVAIARKLALGMAAAHAQGVIHRDLKPQNVLYDKAGHEVLITDFGLARISGVDGKTVDGSVFGTPVYMSPEQARGRQDAVGPLSDVYALGVILYEMLTGRVPFSGSVLEILVHHWETPPDPPSEVRPGLDPRLDTICLKLLAKKPAHRYPSAQALATALSEYLRGTEGGADVVLLAAGPVADPFPPDGSARHPTSRPDSTATDREAVRCPRCETVARVARGRVEPVECRWCNTPFSVGAGREAAARFSESGRLLPGGRSGWTSAGLDPNQRRAPGGPVPRDEWLPAAGGLDLSCVGVLLSVAFLFPTLWVFLASSRQPPDQSVVTLAWIVVAVGQCAGLVMMGLGRWRAAQVPFGVPGRTAARVSALSVWLAVPFPVVCYLLSRTSVAPFLVCLGLFVLFLGEAWFNSYLRAIGPYIGPHFPLTRVNIARMYLRLPLWCALFGVVVTGVSLGVTRDAGTGSCFVGMAAFMGVVSLPISFVMSVRLSVSVAKVVGRHARGEA